MRLGRRSRLHLQGGRASIPAMELENEPALGSGWLPQERRAQSA
jgi:hypothetical protein